MKFPNLGGRVRGSKLFVPGLVLLAFLLGLVLRGAPPPNQQRSVAEEGPGASAEARTLWTCSMHPQVQLPEPGKCPICFMDLIPLEAGSPEDEGPRTLTMSEAAKQLADIVTVPVERRFVDARVRLVGKVEPDETRVKYITAWVPGRLDRLFVDYTGVLVRKGDHLVELYSPELISAQEELLQSVRAAKELERSKVMSVRQATLETIDAARDKLRLLGLTSQQIKDIEQRETPLDHITIYAPIGGVVVHKNATEGMYVDVGTPIYKIADLSHVWVKLDAYESDLMWLHYGQEVSFTTEAYPGESFTGRISFIDPVLDPATRTVKVRVDVENRDGKLKPEMFVRAVVHARVAEGGRVMDPELAGKWISPMHPEIVKDGPGKCDICGMPLVRAEELGFVSAANPTDAPLVIPASAPLVTGRRAVVYVETAADGRPTFEGREVVLGPRAGDHYLVEAGLREGERVVVNGNFKIDSALQIQAKPSMMTPEDRGAGGGGLHQHPGAGEAGLRKTSGEPLAVDHSTHDVHAIPTPAAKFDISHALRQALTEVYDSYFAVHAALAADDLDAAHEAFARVKAATSAFDHRDLDDDAHKLWMEGSKAIDRASQAGAESESLDIARTAFRELTDGILQLERNFGHSGEQIFYTAFCPMAFGSQGAIWLQTSRKIANPYFGRRMARCGEVRETFTPITTAEDERR